MTVRCSYAVKRAIDIVASGLGMLVLSPVFIAIALAARLTLDEARDFLSIAGYALSDSLPADIVYAACFRHRVYERTHVLALLNEFSG